MTPAHNIGHPPIGASGATHRGGNYLSSGVPSALGTIHSVFRCVREPPGHPTPGGFSFVLTRVAEASRGSNSPHPYPGSRNERANHGRGSTPAPLTGLNRPQPDPRNSDQKDRKVTDRAVAGHPPAHRSGWTTGILSDLEPNSRQPSRWSRHPHTRHQRSPLGENHRPVREFSRQFFFFFWWLSTICNTGWVQRESRAGVAGLRHWAHWATVDALCSRPNPTAKGSGRPPPPLGRRWQWDGDIPILGVPPIP